MSDEVDEPVLFPATDAQTERRTQTAKPDPVGAVLAVTGGGLLILGSVLDWVELSGGGTRASASGTDAGEAWLALVMGIIVLAAGLSLLQDGAKRSVALVAVAAASLGGGLGVYEALTAGDWAPPVLAGRLATDFGGAARAIRVLLEAALEGGQSELHIAVGLYLLIAGGALGVVGGAVAARRSSMIPTMRLQMTSSSAEQGEPPPALGPPLPPPPGPGEGEPPPSPWAISQPRDEEAEPGDGRP